MKATGIILAAGASRRMGHPKALLEWAGETFVDRLAGVFQEATGRTPIVVLGHHAAAIRAGARRVFRQAYNPDPERGMLSSLQCGLALLENDLDAFLFMPVDYPAVAVSTVKTLLETLEQQPEKVLAIPRQGERRGHPVAGRVEIAQRLLALPVEGQAREVVHAERGRTVYVETLDEGVHTDVDYPADYERLLQTVQR